MQKKGGSNMSYYREVTKDGHEVLIEQKRGRSYIKKSTDAEALNIMGIFTNLDLLRHEIKQSEYKKETQ